MSSVKILDSVICEKKESRVFTSRSLIRCIPSGEEGFCEITRIYRVQVLSNTGDELFTPRGRCIPPRRAAANSVCAAAAHKPSPRSKSNTPIPLRGTTKVFPAATWYSVRRSCVEMPRTHSAGEGSASPGGGGIVVLMSAFCLEIRSGSEGGR